MSSTDPYLIVGHGIGGAAMAHALSSRGVSVRVLDNGRRRSASLAAAGMYNPMILKRQRLAWRVEEFFDGLEPHYRELEALTGVDFLHPSGIWRRMDNVAERNEWEVRKTSSTFAPHLGEMREAETVIGPIEPGAGLIHVPTAGWVDVSTMLKALEQRLRAEGSWIDGHFDQQSVLMMPQGVSYDGRQYAGVILCRGIGEQHESRFFPDLPFSPAKGQTMVLHVPDLQLKEPWHIGLFIIPLGGDRYRIGSTYSWSRFDEGVEAEKSQELVDRFKERCSLPFEVLDEWVGVRPATKDRKPMLGPSAIDKRVWLFNGLGSRGVMMAPTLAEECCASILDEQPLSTEVDFRRFT